MKTRYIIVVLLAYNLLVIGQSNFSPTSHFKSNMISLNLEGGPTFPIGLTYEQLFTDHLSFEIGAGVLASGVGINYYITNPRDHRFFPSVGLKAMISYSADPMFYAPFGITFLSKNNFQFGANAGILYSKVTNIVDIGSNLSPWFGINIGKRFGEDLSILKEAESKTPKNIVSFNMGISDVLLGVIYERLLTPFLSVEAGLGLIGVTVGTKIYFPSIIKDRLNMHMGISTSIGAFPFIGPTGYKAYLPFGFSYLSKNNIWFSIDGGPQYWFDDNSLLPSFNLRLGKAF